MEMEIKVLLLENGKHWVQVKTSPSQNVPELVKTSQNTNKRLVKTSP